MNTQKIFTYLEINNMRYTNENDIDRSKLGPNPYKYKSPKMDKDERTEQQIIEDTDFDDMISMEDFEASLKQARYEDQNRPVSPQALTLLTWIMTREHPERDYVLLYYKDIAKATRLTQVQAKEAIIRLQSIGIMCRTMVKKVYWLNQNIVHGLPK